MMNLHSKKHNEIERKEGTEVMRKEGAETHHEMQVGGKRNHNITI